MMGTIVEKDKVTVEGGELSEKELEAYLSHIAEQYPNRKLKYLNVKLDGEYVDLSYDFETVPFERVRRITGYLVGTMDRWNNAKRAEERDRVHHGVSCC
jgi:hypothetical protein